MGGEGKTLEAQGPLFRRGVPTLQTSLTLRELPCTATAALVCINFCRCLDGGCRTGKFLGGLGGANLWRVRLSHPVGEWARRERVCLSQEQIYPPSSVAYAPASPQGEAFHTQCKHGRWNFKATPRNSQSAHSLAPFPSYFTKILACSRATACEFLYCLTKNPASRFHHRNCAVLP